MRVKNWALLLVLAGLLALAGCGGDGSGSGSGASDNNARAGFTGPGKKCSAGYVRAKMPWGVKCLVNGELCKRARKSAYVRYGFKCVSGRLDRV